MRIWNRKRRRRDAAPDLLAMLHGYRATCLIVTAVRIGFVEALANGPLHGDALASEIGAHPPSLRRFARALAAIGLVSIEQDRVALTSMARALLRSEAGSWHWAVLIGEEYLPAWSDLRHSVLTGEPAFDRVFGMSAWEHRQRHPEINEAFNRMGNAAPRTIAAITAAIDLSSCGLIVDVGGNRGQLLASLLARHPRARGIVLDLPHVVAGAPDVARAAGLVDRLQAVGGSFFESVPSGGDAYLLQHVLHDWGDDECVTILRRCRAAMRPSSALLIVENVLPEDRQDQARDAIMLDIHMLALLGGKERSVDEYDALLRSAGLELVHHPNARGGMAVLVAKPSGASSPQPPA